MKDFIEHLGLFCGACGSFFNFLKNPALDKKYELRDGEECLVELVFKCPSCSHVRGYDPEDLTLEDPKERERMGLRSPR